MQRSQVVVVVRGPVDLGLVELVARLVLAARQRGSRVCVVGPGAGRLVELIELVGLGGLTASEPRGQPEAGEQGGVQEVVHVRDLPC